MNRKYLFAVIAVLSACALLFGACGRDDAEADSTASQSAGTQELGLADWTLTSTTWSSPNGASVHLSATPLSYWEGQNAVFVVRLEGDVAAQAVCDWDGSAYTASVDLNGADGYCYYVVLASQDEQLEVPVNTPSDPYDVTLIDIASSLESYCDIIINGSEYSGGTLRITDSTLRIQPPLLKNGGESISCTKAYLTLMFNGEEVDRADLQLPELTEDGGYSLEVEAQFSKIPEMEDDQQLTMELFAELSNGQILSAPAGTWVSHDGGLLMGVG